MSTNRLELRDRSMQHANARCNRCGATMRIQLVLPEAAAPSERELNPIRSRLSHLEARYSALCNEYERAKLRVVKAVRVVMTLLFFAGVIAALALRSRNW